MGEKNGLGEERGRKKKKKEKEKREAFVDWFRGDGKYFRWRFGIANNGGLVEAPKLDHILLTIIDTVRNVDTKGKTFPQERKIGG